MSNNFYILIFVKVFDMGDATKVWDRNVKASKEVPAFVSAILADNG